MLKRQLYLYLMGMGEPHQIDVRLDGVLIKRFTVGGEGKGLTAPESFAGNTQGDPGLGSVHAHGRCRASRCASR